MFRPFLPVLLALPAFAASGISLQGILNLQPVWLDLQLPEADGKVSGSYFYLKTRKPIALSGERKGDSLFLTETYGNKVTGMFRLSAEKKPQGDESQLPFPGPEVWIINGTWNKPGKKTGLNVNGYQSDPANRSCILIDLDSLITSGGNSFGKELDENDERERTNSDLEGPFPKREFMVTSCWKGFYSVHAKWIFSEAYHPSGMESAFVRHVFDKATKQEVSLANELDTSTVKSFTAKLAKDLDVQLEGSGAAEILASNELVFYLQHKTLMVGTIYVTKDGGLIKANSLFTEMDYKEIKRYLRKDSLLHRLGRK